MKDFVIINKTPDSVTFIDDEIKTLTREEVQQTLAADPVFDIDGAQHEVQTAEENFAAVVNEIQTKIADREAELESTVKESLESAKQARNEAILKANTEFDRRIEELKAHADSVAADICSMKEEGLKAAKERLDSARKVLDELKTHKAEVESCQLVCERALEAMNVAAQEKLEKEAEEARAAEELTKDPIFDEVPVNQEVRPAPVVRPTRLKF